MSKNSTTYNRILSKGIEGDLPVTIGVNKLRFTTDTGRLYLDNEGTNRIEITDFVKGLTKDQILGTLAPLPKIYLSSDTHELFIYNSTSHEWDSMQSSNAVNASTAQYAVSAASATNASTAYYSENAGSSDYAHESLYSTYADNAENAGTALYSENAGTADYAGNSYYSENAGTSDYAHDANYSENAGTSDYAGSANYAENATSADYATNADYANVSDRANADEYGNYFTVDYAMLNSPIFTGTPTVPDVDAGDESEKIANTNFVSTAISNAIAGITEFDTLVVQTLPKTGTKGIIYFVPNQTATGQNIYDEYIWITSSSKFEKIGSAEVNLTDYVNTVQVTGSGNAVTGYSKNGSTLTLDKGASFLTAHPAVNHGSSTATATPAAGSTIDVITNITTDNFAHATSFVKTTVTLPNSVATATNASSADWATNASTAEYTENASTSDYATTAGTANAVTWGNVSDKPSTFAPVIGNAATQAAAGNHNHDGTYYKKTDTVSTATNASTADYAKAAPWSGITGTPSTYPPSTHTHDTNISTYAGGVGINLENGKSYSLSTGGTSFKFKMPENPTSVSTATNASTADYAKAAPWSGITGTPSTYPPSTHTHDVFSTSTNGFVPKPASTETGKFLKGDGTWANPSDADHQYFAGTGLNAASVSGNNTTFALATTGTAGTYGPTANVTGDNGTTIKVPQITTDAYGRVTAVTERTYTSVDHTYTISSLGGIPASQKGAASGVAELGSDGKVPSSQLPSYVDDVIEGYYYNSKFWKESTHTTEITAESGKIYVDLTSGNNKTYRWSGSAYVIIASDLALGETSSTAYRGDRGKIAYDHSQAPHAPSNAQPNQNAFSNVTVGTTTIAADTTTDTLTLAAGSNVTLTPDATNDKVTIAANNTTYDLSPYQKKAEKINNAATADYATSAGSAGSATSATNAATATYATTAGTANAVTWGNVSNKPSTFAPVIGSGSTQAAAGNHTHSAYVNQNAFSNVIVGSTTVAADTATDALTLVAGSNVTLTPDATNDKVTIAANNTTYDLSPYQKKADKINNASTADYATSAGSAGSATNASSATYATSAGAVAWGNVSGKPSTYPPSSHTHTTSMTTSTGTSAITLQANTKYSLTTGGTSLIFTTPADNNTTYDLSPYQKKAEKINNASTADYATNASTATYAGTAGSANAVAWGNVSNKPSTFAPVIGSGSTQAAAGNHTHSAYVNQNAFSNIVVGSTTVVADTTTDTLTLAAGNNITLTPDATNDKVTIAANNTTYDLSPYQKKADKINNAATADYATNASTATYATTAGSANAVTWGNVSNKPSTFAPVIGSGSTQAAAGNHTHSWSNITSGKPTTISGYGITDFKTASTGAVALNSSTVNQIGYTNGTTAIYGQSDGALFAQAYSGAWVAQIYQDYRSGHIAVRSNNNGTWTEWGRVFDTRNVSGSGGITINSTTAGITIGVGTVANATNAATATYATSAGSANAVAWGNVSSKPSTYAPIIGSASTQAAAGNHNHDTVYWKRTETVTNAATATYATSAGSANAVAWGNVSSKPSTFAPIIGSASTQAAAGNHTHGTAIATSTGTNQLTMAANTKYALGTGGTTYIFTTPPDTKNTAGSTDTSSKIFLIGATSQAANPQTYSQDTAYIGTDGHLYSNSIQVVNLSGSQALTNKTYNGYTLAAACAKAVVTSIDTSASLPTSNAVKTFVEGKGYLPSTTKYAISGSVGGSASSALAAADGCDFDFGEL